MGRRGDVIDLVEWRARREECGAAASEGEALGRFLVSERFAEGWECLADELDAPGP
ncbi:hypothetical protein [Nocardioides zeae]|uniref:Uncharacterized protein n=1 Tax=Nocardioides zeae TaxID=1457234 RepID=A0A6P0HPQ9_9ACTN|nr:hypothetical protein [Nocardioides zeae]NEN80682.1 hypothetical protein [Nocardioides zeae]